jgi:hypothetical protein
MVGSKNRPYHMYLVVSYFSTYLPNNWPSNMTLHLALRCQVRMTNPNNIRSIPATILS